MSNDVGVKFDQEKPTLAYVPKDAMFEMGYAFAAGKAKYSAWNYCEGIEITRTTSAALRHIYQFLDGEDIDGETKANHLGCAMANLAMAIHTLKNHPEKDDRYGKKE